MIISADVIQFGDRLPKTTPTILNQNNANSNPVNEVKEQQSETSGPVKVSEIEVGDVLYFENGSEK